MNRRNSNKKGWSNFYAIFLSFYLIVFAIMSVVVAIFMVPMYGGPVGLLCFLLSIPAWVCIYKAMSYYWDDGVSYGDRVIAPDKTVVEGILDEQSKAAIDKDGDGIIMVSEYFPLSEGEVLEKIKAVDPNFSKEDFYAWVKHLYSTILEALDKKNNLILRRFESDYLYQRHVALFEDKRASGEVISKYYIKGVLLKDFKIEGDKEILVVALTAALNNVNPSRRDYVRRSYLLIFSRNKGLKTNSKLLDDKDTNCPNCGAVLDLDSHGICSYCHTVIPSGAYGWVLIDMRNLQILGD